MGFRDFHSFNPAMLAKQIWWLIPDHDLLCARVLNAKYYPNYDILSAGPKAGSSFTWQSLVAAIPTFKHGYIWRVGSGERINTYTDPWIPSSSNKMIISPRGLGVLTKVADLIDSSTGTWDIELLRSLFLDVDVKRILEIPINIQGFDDFIAWNYNKNGRYSVKSGYLQWRHTFRSRASQLALPGTSALNPVWNFFGNLSSQARSRSFYGGHCVE
jgi:hypothetical protein